MASFAVDWRAELDPVCRGGALTVGNFDGVHRGHQALLAELRRQAQTVGGPAVALTFDPPPLAILRPPAFQPQLTTSQDKAALLQQHGADHVVILRTDAELLNLSAREFFHHIVQERLNVRAVVPGFNFGFGRNREGDVETMMAFCREAGLPCVPVAPIVEAGLAISSSRIRTELLQGAVRHAAALLGRPYQVRGVVATGQRRGQTLGFPTANLEQMVTLLPANGVYAVRVHHRELSWPGAANLGPNPTFGEQARKLEVHLIGFTGDLYGQDLAVEFVEHLRATRPFASAVELVKQLRVDVEQARQVVKGA